MAAVREAGFAGGDGSFDRQRHERRTMANNAHDTALFTTDAVAPRERFAFWREAVCDVFVRLDCERVGGDAFAGSIVTRPFGGMQLSEVASGAQHVRRSRRQIARAREDDLLVSVQLDGAGDIAQDGRDAALGLGDFCLYDSARPYDLMFRGEFRQMVLQFPRRKLAERLGRVESFAGIGISSRDPMGAVVSDFLRTLGRESARIAPAAAERLAETALDLVAAALAAARGAAAGEGARRSATLARAKTLALTRLGDAALTPASLAAALGVAPRSLHRLFADDGQSFMRWVMDRRLDACRRDLADPALGHRSVSDIAFGHGFADLSHFSRAFRRRFAQAPSELRAAAGFNARRG